MLLPVWASHNSDVERLQREWQTEYEKRAGGGAIALSGFHYQFLITLHDTLRAWLKRPPFERGRPKILTECLSDILDKSSNDVVLITQVKRTNRSGSFQEALNELWLIYELALEVTPNLVPYLHFRILSNTSELKDFERALSKWHPNKQQPVSLDLEIFRQSVTVQLFSNPEDEVLALLANDLHATEPTTYVHRWLGRLLSAASKEGTSGFEDAAQLIWDDLQSIENSSLATPPGIYIWTSQDKAPETILEGEVLTGERPQTHHLREGFFAPRPVLYSSLAAQAEKWSTELTSNPDKQIRLPVFWIGGRSGSGKSVALMHVLALLYESGIGPVLWLGNKTELLRQAIPWALKLRANNRQVIIGTDDPYAPNTQNNDIIWKEALALLEGVRQRGDASALPLIICCGPSEQADRMQRDLTEEVNVNVREIPEEDQEDIFQLRSWYMQRTKKSPPNIGDENVLLVQLFFQWETGQELRQFASRFRSRIKESDPQGRLDDLITCMLCVNRLYVGYPLAAVEKRLTPDLQDTLSRLREEHHVTQNVSDHGIGLWLAHPHLSNLIYESWYPLDSNQAIRTDHLRRVITECLEFGASPGEKMAPLWAISNAMVGSSAQSPLVGRIDQETITNLLPSVYTSRMQVLGEEMTLAELPVWIQLQALSAGEVLEPAPVSEALDRIKASNLEEKGLRLTCHKLLQYYKSFTQNQQSRISESIIELLTQAPHWHEWAPVADDAYRRTKDPRLVQLIIDWVNDHPRSKWGGRLFLLLFNDKHTDPQMLSVAGDLLSRVGGGLGWGDIALRLMEVFKPEIPVSVLEWATHNRRQWGACFVLGKLLERGRRVARGWAFQWCARWHTDRTANYVLEPLLILLGPNEKLRDWCMRWVAVEHRNVNTGYIIEKMINTFPSDPKVISMGVQWLENNDFEHVSWQYVWRALYNTAQYETLTVINRRTNLPLPIFSSDSNQLGQDESAIRSSQALPEGMLHDPKAWYYLAIGLGKARRYDEEVAALIRATELEPQFPEAWQALGVAYGQLGQNESALMATLKLTELRPDDHEAWYSLSIAYGRGGHYGDQVNALIKATELNPQFAKAWWALRNTYAQFEQDESAIDAEIRLAGLESENPESWYDLAIIFGKNESYETQVTALTKATKLNPNFADAWQALGHAYYQLGRTEQALAANTRLVELRPDDAKAWYYLSVVQRKAGHNEESVATLLRAVTLDPQFAEAWQILAAIYNQLGHREQALAANTRLVELRPDDAQAWYYLAISHSKVGNDEEQLAALIKATELDPRHVETWQRLSAVYVKRHQYDLWVKARTKIVELKPDDTIAQQKLSQALAAVEALEHSYFKPEDLTTEESREFYGLAKSYVASGQIDEAILAFKGTIKASADEIKASSTLLQSLVHEATAEFHNECYEKAIILLKIIITMDQNIADTWRLLSSSYHRVGREEEALDAAEYLSTLTPTDAHAWYKLGKRYASLGQIHNAAEAFNQALQLNKNLYAALRELNKLQSKNY